ncbi:allatostatin-A receptor-like [Asterias rubens]|uniref:allatostatin-A receptor-like n=1 Tax=Asterias rubens TaxID=7604 RepID=UPI0014558ED8|nr:allatostatin-A receptor-like [Asterias rubens]
MSWFTLTPRSVAQSFAILTNGDDNSSSSSSSSYFRPECEYKWPTMPIIVILCFIYIVICLIGFIGNFLVVFTIFYKKGQQSVTSMLLCSLAVSDIIVVSIYLPMKLVDLLTTKWVLGEVACKIIGYLNLISPACSACMLMVIGLERFIVILYPLRARSFITRTRAKIIVVITWVVSLILGIPGLVLQIHENIGDPGFADHFICRKDYSDSAIKKGYNLYGLTILYIIPLTIMGVAYVTVSLRLNASAKTSRGLQSMKTPRSSTSQQYIYNKPTTDSSANRSNGFRAMTPNTVQTSVDDDPFSAASESRYDGGRESVSTAGAPPARQRRRQRRPVTLKDRQQVILMLILVVALYAITWGPLLVIAVLFAFDVFNDLCRHALGQMSSAAHIWAFLNSTVNPIVYSFMSRNFRETVREALRSCCRCFIKNDGQTRRGRESMYYNSRCSTTVVTQASSVKRNRSTSDGNCSPCKGQNIEMSQYTRLPNTEPIA